MPVTGKLAAGIPRAVNVVAYQYPAMYKGDVVLGSDPGYFNLSNAYPQLAVTNAAMDIIVPVFILQPGDYHVTLTLVYAVVTEALDAAGTWTLKSLDGDGTTTTVATGSGTGITAATHTVTFTVNSTNRTQLGYFINIDNIDGGAGGNSVVRTYSLGLVAKRPVDWVVE